MKPRDFTPLLLWFCLFTAIVVLAFLRPGQTPRTTEEPQTIPDTVIIILYLVWMLLELPISRRDADTEGKQTSDSATCPLYAVGQALTILSALWFSSSWRVPNLVHCLGISIFLLGVSYRLWAIRTLGQFYSHRVRMVANHQIVDSGPYRYTRHPAYAGMMVANAGICVYFFNYVTTLTFLLILLPSILRRIAIEEKVLFRIEGYRVFAESRKRLFPAVW